VDTRLGASFHSTAQWMRLRVARDVRSHRLPHPVGSGRRVMPLEQRTSMSIHAVVVHRSVASNAADRSCARASEALIAQGSRSLVKAGWRAAAGGHDNLIALT